MASATATESAVAPEAQTSVSLQQVLSAYPIEYLECRGVWHKWDIIKSMHITVLTDEGHLVEEHLQCERCETIRRDRNLLRQDRWSVQRLERLHPAYQYPEDYLLSEMGKVDHAKELVRFERLKRTMGGQGNVTRAMKRATKKSEQEQAEVQEM